MNLIITLIGGLVSFLSVIRALIMAGFCRARIVAIWAAWTATCSKKIASKADAYVKSLPSAQEINQIAVRLSDNAWQSTVTVIYNGSQWAATATRATAEAASSAAFRCAQANGAAAARAQKITQLTAEANQALNASLSGAPAVVAAFFLNNPASACEQDGSSGSIVTKIYVSAKVKLEAKASTASVETRNYSASGECCGDNGCCAVTSTCREVKKKPKWVLSNVPAPEYILKIDEKPDDFCSEVYEDIKNTVANLDAESVAGMIDPPPEPPIEEWISQQAQLWIDQLNSQEPTGADCSDPAGGEGDCAWNPYVLVSTSQEIEAITPPPTAENEIGIYLGEVDYNVGVMIDSSKCSEDCDYDGECAECQGEC